ncbi:MAG: OadG family protein [Clostridia bacterium]|nr:OadG family protein [Clostridia bacterium]
MEMYLGAKTLLVALIGMMVVFLGLVVLIVLINIMGKLTSGMGKKEATKAAPAAAPVAAAAPVTASLIKPDAVVRPAKVDDETVAVLTAAIAATRGEGYPFKIKRIIRVNR